MPLARRLGRAGDAARDRAPEDDLAALEIAPLHSEELARTRAGVDRKHQERSLLVVRRRGEEALGFRSRQEEGLRLRNLQPT